MADHGGRLTGSATTPTRARSVNRRTARLPLVAGNRAASLARGRKRVTSRPARRDPERRRVPLDGARRLTSRATWVCRGRPHAGKNNGARLLKGPGSRAAVGATPLQTGLVSGAVRPTPLASSGRHKTPEPGTRRRSIAARPTWPRPLAVGGTLPMLAVVEALADGDNNPLRPLRPCRGISPMRARPAGARHSRLLSATGTLPLSSRLLLVGEGATNLPRMATGDRRPRKAQRASSPARMRRRLATTTGRALCVPRVRPGWA